MMKKLLIVLFLLFALPLFSQDGGPIDWGQLGVDTVFVGVIITVVQLLKNSVLNNVPGWVFMLVTMLLSTGFGVLQLEDKSNIEALLQVSFTYMAASAWLYNVAKRSPVLSMFIKDGKAAKQ